MLGLWNHYQRAVCQSKIPSQSAHSCTFAVMTTIKRGWIQLGRRVYHYFVYCMSSLLSMLITRCHALLVVKNRQLSSLVVRSQLPHAHPSPPRMSGRSWAMGPKKRELSKSNKHSHLKAADRTSLLLDTEHFYKVEFPEIKPPQNQESQMSTSSLFTMKPSSHPVDNVLHAVHLSLCCAA